MKKFIFISWNIIKKGFNLNLRYYSTTAATIYICYILKSSQIILRANSYKYFMHSFPTVFCMYTYIFYS